MTPYTQRRLAMASRVVAVVLLVVLGLSGCGRMQQAKKPNASDIADRVKPARMQTINFNVAGVKMLKGGVGWAWGSKADKLTVLRTTDSGKHWTVVALPEPPKLEGTNSIGGVSVDFTDSHNGWLVFATGTAQLIAYRTTDAGKTWKKSVADIVGMGAQVQFVNNKTGWILVHQGAATLHEEISFLHTTDGGVTWQVIATSGTDQAPSSSNLPFAGEKNGFTFRDANNGFLTSYQPVPGKAFVYATVDAGRTWLLQTIPINKADAEADLSAFPPLFFGGKDGILPVVVGGKEQPAIFYSSRDGGRTWVSGTPIKSSGKQPWVWSFSDTKHGFVTDGSRFYTTTDGGKKWANRKLDAKLARANQVMQLDFTSSKQGWAVVAEQTGALYQTSNSGRTWRKVSFTTTR